MYVDPKMFNPSKRKRRAFLLNHLLGRHHHTWREHEKDVLRERDADLDRRLLADTDASLMDDEFLEDALRVCLNDTDCIPAACRLALDLFRVSTITLAEQEAITDSLHEMLNVLESELKQSAFKPGPQYHESSPSLLLAICRAAELDESRELSIQPSLIRILRHLMKLRRLAKRGKKR